ncbi:Chk1 protein kinase, variant 2 [Umbelopsis sp. WA50703]
MAGGYSRRRPNGERSTPTITESSNITTSELVPSSISISESFSDTSSGRGGTFQYERSAQSHDSIADDSDCSGSAHHRHFTRKPGSTVIAITGPSGVGKSALFNAVQTTARHYGFVATAKFDSRNLTPFACIARCISQILRQIMSETADINILNAVKETLEAQYVNIKRLLEWIPELAFALGDIEEEDTSPLIADFAVQDNRAELHFVFVQVIRALAQHKMITFFLDDLHQADQPSLDLLFALVAAKTNLLFIISFREEAVSDKINQIMDLDKASVQHIHLDNLDMTSLTEFICKTLHRPVETTAEAVQPLVELVYRQTRGNPFYTCQLLRSFAGKENLIFFNWDENQWDYDAAGIEQYITSGEEGAVDDEVDVSYLTARLRELPSETQRFLRYASFIGNSFSWQAICYLMSSNVEEVSNDEDDDCVPSRNTLHPLVKLAHTYDDHPKKSNMSKNRGAINGLQTALQEGLIVPLDKDEFRWSHDRYSQAAMAMVSPSVGEQIHYKIALYYLQDPKNDSITIADHLLHCADLIKTCSKRPQYRDILTKAGMKQQNSGAHSCAIGNVTAALALLDPEPWKESSYAQTLQLYTMAASLSWVAGETSNTDKYLDEIFDNVTEPMDRLPAYRIKSKYFYAKGMHDESFKTLFACLSEFGITKIDPDLTRNQCDNLYVQVTKMLDSIGLEKVSRLQRCASMDRLRHQSLLSILEETLTAAYWLGRQSLMFYIAAKMVELSVQRGIVSPTGVAFQYLGLAAVEFYQQYAYGEQLGALGLVLVDKYGANSEKGRARQVYATFLSSWKHHLRDVVPLQESALRYSRAAGDRIYASSALLHIATQKLFIGDNLWDVLQAAQACYEEVHTWSPAVDTNILIMSILRTVKALQGKTYVDDAKFIFDGDDGFNDAHFVGEICQHSANPSVPITWYQTFKMLPLVLFGHSEEAVRIGELCHAGIHNHLCQRNTRFMMFLHSLAIINVLRESKDMDSAKRQDLRATVLKNQELISDWVRNSPGNFEMWYTLVEAEFVALDNNFVESCKLYEKAMDRTRDGHWMLEKCITYEYAGEFYLRNGITNVAVALLRKAVKAYTAHGSYGKAQQLCKKHQSVFALLDEDEPKEVNAGVQTDVVPLLGHRDSWGELSVSNMPSSMSPSPSPPGLIFNEPDPTDSVSAVTAEQALATLDIVDLASILKSSQVISSEVKFDSLLQSMMTIILDNSAAECGAIIVKDEYFGICAFGTRHGPPSTFDPPKPLREEDDMISNRIVQHTLNTCESTLIPNVQLDARFAVGSWFERAGVKSIICLPVLHKGVLAGCLYLEGSPGIFTQRHITVLTLLCQQMGISLTNAFLFKSIQKVTMTNVRMIETQKLALEEARKSKEAALRATHLREIFLANMSHEIRTPFSGFYGMISLLSETQLDAEQQDLVRTAKESCEMLLRIIDDLLNFSKLQASKVTLDVSRIVLEDVIADVVEILVAMAARKDLTVAYFVDDDVPPFVMADGNRLRQVLMNLVGNAIKFTDKGEVIVRCSLNKQTPVDDGNVELLFEVIDSGIGISESQLKALFKPFSQVDGSTTRLYGGTGLGLSICMQLVQLMSGKISVTSTPGVGSNFFFNIRVQTAEDPNQENLEMEVREDIQGFIKALGRPRILIGSGSKSMVQMMRGFMSSFEIASAESLGAIKAELMLASYDVLILDFPITAEFAEQIRKIESTEATHNMSIIVLHYPSGDVLHLHQDKINLPDGSSKLIRMAIPVRRLKLLRAVADLLNCAPTKRTSRTVKMSSASQIFTPEELAYFKTVRILIAEDNPVAQKLLFKQLTRLGFMVDCANNGLEAVRLWEIQPETYYSVALFDHHMPICDGVEATKRIRKEEEASERTHILPIIALTADVQQTARDICTQAGMSGYLTKPLNQNSLADLLRKHLFEKSSDDSSTKP